MRDCRLLAMLMAALCACSESLPPRVVPDEPLQFARILASQGTGDDGILVDIAVVVENVYGETFEGDVDVQGKVHIWWRDRPEIEAHLPLTERRRVRLDPGDRYRTGIDWLLLTDDGRDVLGLLDFSARDIRAGVIYAAPEVFVAEVRLSMFADAGLQISGRREFTLQGWRVLAEDELD